jgi:hypothetical protein
MRKQNLFGVQEELSSGIASKERLNKRDAERFKKRKEDSFKHMLMPENSEQDPNSWKKSKLS